MMDYPKRLIEVDLPIKRISAHARREKSIRHGHISTLHIWWARRPLAACRAVICAALWPDPADPLCPESFRQAARTWMRQWAANHLTLLEAESLKRFLGYQKDPGKLDDNEELRCALLDFIADFANWDNSTRWEYLQTARALTQTAHEALGGLPGTRPLVVDPFAGGGAIPLEALRVGADAFASDLNPVAVLLNKVVLEYIPKYGQQLADEVRKWGEWVKKEAEKELAEFYPKDPDGATPIAYLWARTIRCEGPGCGAEVPLIRSLWLAKKGNRSVALRLIPNRKEKRVDFEIIENARGRDVGEGTVRRGSATCPICGYTTPVASVRRQLKERRGGTADARLFCVVTTRPGQQGRFYRLPTERDLGAVKKAAAELERRQREHQGPLSLVPDEALPVMSGVFNAPIYGHDTWGSLFTPRQALAMLTLTRTLFKLREKLNGMLENGLEIAILCSLALTLNKVAERLTSLSRYDTSAKMSGIIGIFSGQRLPMVWDFGEGNPLLDRSSGWEQCLKWHLDVLSECSKLDLYCGNVIASSALAHPLSNDIANCVFTDPPYYNAVPYADLSDFFYVWLRRTIGNCYPDLFADPLTPKEEEICEMAGWDPDRYPHKDGKWFEQKMTQAMAEGWRILNPAGVGVVVFAHKSTDGWEAMLQAMIDAGWTITASWPIDTEMSTRLRARNSAALASSIHLVCRPRINSDGSGQTDNIGDWRDVLQELPRRIHDWLPRLAKEGVVGADAIFACLGPALEVFSRYSRVEKASGEVVTLKEYLEHVWAAVAREALGMIFEGADATGFEEDARLTAMWLWTLSTGPNGNSHTRNQLEFGLEAEERDDGEEASRPAKISGFVLEYDAARKIAQGLGAHLENLASLVEVKGETARLLPVAERSRYLFGKGTSQPGGRKKKQPVQMQIFGPGAGAKGEEGEAGEMPAFSPGATVLDRLHQSMLLFGTGRGEALKRFLVEEGAGRDPRLWRLAQALSALYPASSEEKRWVDGVLVRKKGLGF
ncbi:DUF1156 domain-containing protein [Neomoorella thermoacetica]|uniref:DUF1156 domain-containing protein n=1 Tax=Neomoorella thermoacetica TaxID=1525 RepID=UPI0030CA99A7